MNIYMIQISSNESEWERSRKNIGFSSAKNEYDALRSYGFIWPELKSYRQNDDKEDEWIYTAENAVNCYVYATKIYAR